MQICLNKSLIPHNSLGMINKVFQLSNIQTAPVVEKRIFPSNPAGYRAEYKNLLAPAKNVGRPKIKTKAELERDFIAENVNGGFAFDGESVML